MSAPSLLVVVQRYGDVPGGAEAHARSVVRRLAPHFAIDVATTTATDYLTWKSELTAGMDVVDGVTVRRFPVERLRAWNFKLRERRAFRVGHSLDDEWAFIEAQGPYTPELLEFLFAHGREYDHVLFFTYIYYPTVLGLPLVPERAALVPTAHDESALQLAAYKPVFHAPRAIAYNTEEERRMVWRRFGNERVPNEIVGVGVDAPADRDAGRFREKHGIDGPYLLYVGRIGVSKGSRELFESYQRWRTSDPAHDVSLVLIGDAEIAIPRVDGIRHLGRLPEADKWDALAGCAALVMPSTLESLSLVTLEAWAAARPVIVDAHSPVLAGMSRRAGAGLAYQTYAEFAEIVELLVDDPGLGDRLGRAGAAFVARTYTWPRVVDTYVGLFDEVRARRSSG
ncbi:MAG TPA: glycosyltransferase family 4 protein [Candidatus Limnocylindria bacterium]|nr:glycosyltransferase family 4 protein [Candidatus Limnocylindria bacterium]